MATAARKTLALGSFALALAQACAADPPGLRRPDLSGSTPPTEFTTRPSAELFAWPNVPVFDFTLPPDRWAFLKATAREEQYEPAEVRFEGKPLGSAGLRFKGSYGTLDGCFDSTGQLICPKLSMKVDFAEYAPAARFFGLKRLNFHSMNYDQTKLRERLAYDLYREMEIFAPRSAWAVLRVNGESLGLYSMVEQIDGRFTADRFPGRGDGNLYKEVWPTSPSTDHYARKLETNEAIALTDGSLVRFVAFYQALAGAAGPNGLAAALAGFTDPDYLARYMAVDDAMNNADGITAFYCSPSSPSAVCTNHNYYWYQEEDRAFFWLIPWDLDFSFYANSVFGVVPRWTAPPADCALRYNVWSGEARVQPPGCDPVLQGVSARSPAYAAAVQRLVDGPFAPARMADQIRRHADFIASAVAADPIGAGDVAWRSAVAGLDRDLALLRRRAELFRDGQNVVPIAVVPQGVNDFEQADELGIIFGASSMSNPASSVRHVLNRSGALQGAQDLKIEFEYRNEPRPDGAWEQWTYFTVGFLGGPQDLRARTGLRMLVRADQTRRLRIELESPAHRAANEGIRLGWYATAGSGAAVVEVRFAEAGLPEWARATGDVLGDVLARSTGIALQAYVVGNGSDGFLPDGATDPGYLEIDALEVF